MRSVASCLSLNAAKPFMSASQLLSPTPPKSPPPLSEHILCHKFIDCDVMSAHAQTIRECGRHCTRIMHPIIFALPGQRWLGVPYLIGLHFRACRHGSHVDLAIFINSSGTNASHSLAFNLGRRRTACSSILCCVSLLWCDLMEITNRVRSNDCECAERKYWDRRWDGFCRITVEP